MFLSKAVLQTVLAITVGTAHAGVFEGIDERLAGNMGTLIGVVDGGFFGRWAVLLLICAVATPRPFSGVRALVGGFGSVVETEGTLAGFTSKGEKVELATIFELAVAADRFEIGVGHLDVGFSACGGG